ncbi:hypothetical protein [Methylobacterium sp. ID0610]|uniref:hypothetical protein n=1 Tax=Methylobacterium carpenticola TaxID=3344827 RepID=UPI0036D14695
MLEPIMYEGYRVVAVMPAGRRQYMEIIIPYIISSELVDELHLWVNTNAAGDLDYIHSLAARHAKIKPILPTAIKRTGDSWAGLTIGQFFQECIDTDAIYIRFDDDVVYLEEYFFERFLRYRVANPDHFVVFPQIINNSVSTFLMNCQGVFAGSGAAAMAQLVGTSCTDPVGWAHGGFAESVHRFFLDTLRAGRLDAIRIPSQTIFGRFSVNCFAWFGKRFAEFSGVVPGDEEFWISAVGPVLHKSPASICGDAICAHWAFTPQRHYLEATDLLEEYRRLARETYPASYAGEGSLSYERGQSVQTLASANARVSGRYRMFVNTLSAPGPLLALHPDGRITDEAGVAAFANEHSWKIHAPSGQLFLFSRAGEMTSVLACTSLGRLDNDSLEFAGPFVADLGSGVTYILRSTAM